VNTLQYISTVLVNAYCVNVLQDIHQVVANGRICCLEQDMVEQLATYRKAYPLLDCSDAFTVFKSQRDQLRKDWLKVNGKEESSPTANAPAHDGFFQSILQGALDKGP
jgi:hypothetical protein